MTHLFFCFRFLKITRVFAAAFFVCAVFQSKAFSAEKSNLQKDESLQKTDFFQKKKTKGVRKKKSGSEKKSSAAEDLSNPQKAQLSQNIEKNDAPKNSLCALLAGYLQNSLELKRLSLDAQKAALNSKQTSLANGMNISLATGTIAFSFGRGGTFSFLPNAALAIPAAQNLRFTASSNVSVREGKNEVKNTSLGVSVDLYSDARENRKIALMKAERALLESRRALQNGFVKAETQFYEKLKSLFEIESKIVLAKKSFYEHNLELEQLRLQGYGERSSKFRLKQMERQNDEHDTQIFARSLERELKIFARECGVEYNGNAQEFLPNEFPLATQVDILDFPSEDFCEIEKAVWENSLNEKIRRAEKSFSVSVNAGYTFSNTLNSFMTNAMEYGDTVDAGAALSWNATGLQASAGVSLPMAPALFNPLYKMSLAFSPNQFRIEAVQKKINFVQEKIELNAIECAKKNYETQVLERQTLLEDLLWQKSANEKSFESHSILERDTAAWYRQGMVSQSDLQNAQASKENYRIKVLLNLLDLIIYNNETAMLFVRDEELKNEKKR